MRHLLNIRGEKTVLTRLLLTIYIVTIVVVTVTSVVPTATSTFSGTSTAPATTADLDPGNITKVVPEKSGAAVSSTFIVNVTVINVTKLYGYEFMLWYNTTVLDSLNVTLPLGHFLTPTDPLKIFVPKNVTEDNYNATHGRVWFALSLLAPELPRNGSGTLATIVFNVTALGSSDLQLYYPNYTYPVKLSDNAGKAIPCTAEDGYFTSLIPKALFTYSPLIPLVNQTVTFNASSSYHPVSGRSIVNYTWDFGDNSSVVVTNQTIATHNYTSGRAYIVNLTVTDNVGETDTSLKTVKVGPPVAAFGYSPAVPLVNQLVTFNASASYDMVGGTIASYAWDFGDNSSVVVTNQTIATHNYTSGRAYIVNLTVTDNDGLTGTSTGTVKVGPPVAIFTYSPETPLVDQVVTFNASASYDVVGGTIASYAWDFGDNTTGTGMTADHTYTSAGDKTVTLTVTDNDGLTHTITKSITVQEAPPSYYIYAIAIIVIVIVAAIAVYLLKIRKH